MICRVRIIVPRIPRMPRMLRMLRMLRMHPSLQGLSSSQPQPHPHPHLHPCPVSNLHLSLFSWLKTVEEDEMIEPFVIQSAWRFEPLWSDWIEESAHEVTILCFSALSYPRSMLRSTMQKSSAGVPYRSTGELLLLTSQRQGSIKKKHYIEEAAPHSIEKVPWSMTSHDGDNPNKPINYNRVEEMRRRARNRESASNISPRRSWIELSLHLAPSFHSLTTSHFHFLFSVAQLRFSNSNSWCFRAYLWPTDGPSVWYSCWHRCRQAGWSPTSKDAGSSLSFPFAFFAIHAWQTVTLSHIPCNPTLSSNYLCHT